MPLNAHFYIFTNELCGSVSEEMLHISHWGLLLILFVYLDMDVGWLLIAFYAFFLWSI